MIKSDENLNKEEVNTITINKKYKALLILNIIVFSIICILEIYDLFNYYTILSSFFKNETSSIVGFIAFLPLFILVSLAIIVLSIILSILVKIKSNNSIISYGHKTTFDKICLILSWCFTLFNIIAFIILFIMAKSK